MYGANLEAFSIKGCSLWVCYGVMVGVSLAGEGERFYCWGFFWLWDLLYLF
jgi:hypothetical protein